MDILLIPLDVWRCIARYLITKDNIRLRQVSKHLYQYLHLTEFNTIDYNRNKVRYNFFSKNTFLEHVCLFNEPLKLDLNPLTRLRSLAIYCCPNINSSCISSLAQLTNLKISDDIIYSVAHLKLLQKLESNYSYILNHVVDLKYLTKLRFNNKHYESYSLNKLTNLKTLILSGNIGIKFNNLTQLNRLEIKKGDAQEIDHFVNLTKLVIPGIKKNYIESGNRLTRLIELHINDTYYLFDISEMKYSMNLERLKASRFSITNDVVRDLAKLAKLTSLSILYPHSKETIQKKILNLNSLTNLKELDMVSCNKVRFPGCIGLTYLSICDVRLRNLDLQKLTNLISLKISNDKKDLLFGETYNLNPLVNLKKLSVTNRDLVKWNDVKDVYSNLIEFNGRFTFGKEYFQ